MFQAYHSRLPRFLKGSGAAVLVAFVAVAATGFTAPEAFAQAAPAKKPTPAAASKPPPVKARTASGAKVKATARPSLARGAIPARAAPSERQPTVPGLVAVKNTDLYAAAAGIPPSALLHHGCLDLTHAAWLRQDFGPSWAEWRERAGLGPVDPSAAQALEGCVRFAAVSSPTEGIQTLALLPADGSVSAAEPRRALLFQRPAAGQAPVTGWLELGERASTQREVWLSTAAVASGDLGDRVPARWQREIEFLQKRMKRDADIERAAWVRLVFGDDASQPLLAIEWVDRSGEALDSVIWLDRAGAPGGFVSARGESFERHLWKMPLLDYTRISRGVGMGKVTLRKRVATRAKTPSGKPRFVVRSFIHRGQHEGVDFAAATGTPVIAVAEGAVLYSGWRGGYGNLVVIDHGAGITTYYAHLSAYSAGVEEGARIERGQEIGLVGSTGMSTGPHLHFEIRKDGKYIDPANSGQTLINWGLATGEHDKLLARLLPLSLSRQAALAKAVRGSVIATAPLAAPVVE